MMMDNLQSHVVEATKAAIKEWYAQQEVEYQAARAKDRKARRSKQKASQWEEVYPLRVRHSKSESGRSADIVLDGCNRKITVKQSYNRPMYRGVWDSNKGRMTHVKANEPPMWEMSVVDPDATHAIEAGENFESMVQKAIVLMLGHAYVEAGL